MLDPGLLALARDVVGRDLASPSSSYLTAEDWDHDAKLLAAAVLDLNAMLSHDPTQRAEATTTPEGAKGWVDQAGSAQVLVGGHGLDVAPDASPGGSERRPADAQDGGGKPSNAPTAASALAVAEQERDELREALRETKGPMWGALTILRLLRMQQASRGAGGYAIVTPLDVANLEVAYNNAALAVPSSEGEKP